VNQRPPAMPRAVKSGSGGGVFTPKPKKSRATAWIIWIALALMLVAFVVVWWLMVGMVQDVTFELPREQAVVQSYPEVGLNATFKGIWGEADRGTWIFEYVDVEPKEAAAVLLKNAKEAGWTVVEEKPNEVRLRKKESGAWGSHLVVRIKSDRLRILLMAPGRDAWDKRQQTDLYEDPFYKKFVAPRW
jgi:hypothetical protein